MWWVQFGSRPDTLEVHVVPPNTADEQVPITPRVFAHLVELAQFELSEEEGDYLRRELNGQMKSIRQLEAIELDDDVPITSHGVPYTPEIRPQVRSDETRPSDRADAILDGAPETDDRYIVVPDIPHEELS